MVARDLEKEQTVITLQQQLNDASDEVENLIGEVEKPKKAKLARQSTTVGASAMATSIAPLATRVGAATPTTDVRNL